MGKDKFYIVRTYSAGAWAGNVKERNGQEVTMTNAIRLWRWEGANTLSEIAMHGVAKPQSCKFSKPVDEVLLLQAVEIITATNQAEEIIKSVEVWPWWT